MRHIERAEPVIAHLRQHAAFSGNGRREYPIERADPIRTDKNQPVAEIVYVADLPPSNGQTGKIRFNDGRAHSERVYRKTQSVGSVGDATAFGCLKSFRGLPTSP